MLKFKGPEFLTITCTTDFLLFNVNKRNKNIESGAIQFHLGPIGPYISKRRKTYINGLMLGVIRKNKWIEFTNKS